MKPPATLCLSILLVAATVRASAAAAETARPVKIAEGRASDWRIVCPPPASPAINWAARELQKYLGQISGCKLPIVTRTRGKPAVAIGLRPELSPADRALLPPPAPGYDGYAIAIAPATAKTPARIVIAGDNARGVIYGVYDLLERLGCRWFYPTEDSADPEVVPRQDSVSLATGSWAVASPMKYRICNGSEWFFEMEAVAALKQLEWAMKARYNAMGWQADTHTPLETQYRQLADTGLLAALKTRDMLLHGPAHCFNLLLRAEDYMTNHPSWFGLRNGKRVPQSLCRRAVLLVQPGGAQEVHGQRRDVRPAGAGNRHPLPRAVRRRPGLRVRGVQESRRQQPADAPHGRSHRAAQELPARSAGRDRRRLRADDRSADTAQIHPQQRVVWAHWGRGYTMGYDDPRYDRKDNLEKWRRAARGGITLCQYYTDNFAEPWVMSPFTVAMEGDRRYFLEKGIDSVYMLMWPRGYWWNHSLNGYLAGRCFYDFSLDPYDLLRDYARQYFGPQAGPLLADYFEAWARNPELCYRVRGGSRDQDRAALADQRQRLIEPAIRLAANDPSSPTASPRSRGSTRWPNASWRSTASATRSSASAARANSTRPARSSTSHARTPTKSWPCSTRWPT